MQSHRNEDGELLPRRANPSPAVANHVHGLGESPALRVDLEPVQLPWLADEIDTLRDCIDDELGRARARRDRLTAGREAGSAEAREAEAEVDRRAYQLQVLDMIREQLPLSSAVVAACVANPWEQPSDLALELARVIAPVTVVGPARGMMVLIRGAARHVADALGEALRGPQRDVGEPEPGSYATHWPEWHRTSGAVANRLRDTATAAQAFTDTYVSALAQQSYSFDPEYQPVLSDELW